MASQAWADRIESIALGLLTIEINTIRKSGMSAQKMPELPIALHSIVDCYADFLSSGGYGVTQFLLDLASQRISGATDVDQRLTAWKAEAAPLDAAKITNGAAMFEAMRWAAAAAIRDDNIVLLGPAPEKALHQEVRAIFVRIVSNCRQLVPLVQGLTAKYSASGKLFGGTLEETAQAVFSGARNYYDETDVVILIRKVWDIGTETVLAQTSVQVDGDMVTRISPDIEGAQKDFLLALHTNSVKTGLAQWQAMFDLVKSLIGELGQMLFAPRR